MPAHKKKTAKEKVRARNRREKSRTRTASIRYDIPKGLHRDFKIECLRRNIYLQEGIVQAMNDKLQQWKGVSGNENEW